MYAQSYKLRKTVISSKAKTRLTCNFRTECWVSDGCSIFLALCTAEVDCMTFITWCKLHCQWTSTAKTNMEHGHSATDDQFSAVLTRTLQ